MHASTGYAPSQPASCQRAAPAAIQTQPSSATPRLLLPGEALPGDVQPLPPGWRVLTGALWLHPAGDDSSPVRLALPGDLVGAEGYFGGACVYEAHALVATTVQPLQLPADAEERRQRLAELLERQWQRSIEMMQLRSGPVAERVRQLLLLLGGASGDTTLLLPRVRDFAAVLGSTPESISRVVTNLRRLSLLSGRSAKPQRVSADALAGSRLPEGMTRGRLGAGGLPLRPSVSAFSAGS